MIFVELEPLLDGFNFFQIHGIGQVEGFLCHFNRVGEITGLGVSHAEGVEDERLAASGESIGLAGERERGLAVAKLRIYPGGENMGEVGEGLIVIRVEPQRGVGTGQSRRRRVPA